MTEKERMILKYETRAKLLQKRDPVVNAKMIKKAERNIRKWQAKSE